MGRREYCARELRDRLAQRGFPEDSIEAAISRLIEDGYLSEQRFAEGFIRTRMRRGEAPWLAAEKARQRGADEAAVARAQALAEQGFDALAQCRALLAARDPAGRYREDERQWQKQARFLRNKGYDAATILRALNDNPEDQR